MTQKKDQDAWMPLWREAVRAISLGWDMAVPIFGGVFLGYTLDRWLGTGHMFTLGLLILGVAIGYYNLARFIRRVDERSQQIEEARMSSLAREYEADASRSGGAFIAGVEDEGNEDKESEGERAKR